MRANLYLLGAALFDEPRRERHEYLRALMWRVIYRSPPDAQWVPPLLEIADAHEREDRLHKEHARLFLTGESGAHPCGSFWLEPDHEPMGSSTREVARLMRRHGMTLDEHAGMPADHLVAELEFMAVLAAREQAEQTRTTQSQLLHDHLGIWVPHFTDAVRACHASRFYRMAAHYLDELIAWDIRRLQEKTRQSIAA